MYNVNHISLISYTFPFIFQSNSVFCSGAFVFVLWCEKHHLNSMRAASYPWRSTTNSYYPYSWMYPCKFETKHISRQSDHVLCIIIIILWLENGSNINSQLNYPLTTVCQVHYLLLWHNMISFHHCKSDVTTFVTVHDIKKAIGKIFPIKRAC